MHYRQLRLPYEWKFAKTLVVSDGGQLNRIRKSFHWLQINGNPLIIICRWVRVGTSDHLSQANYFFSLPRVIEEHTISDFHSTQIVTCLIISHSRPVGAAIFHEVVPRISFGFLLHHPVAVLCCLFHLLASESFVVLVNAES